MEGSAVDREPIHTICDRSFASTNDLTNVNHSLHEKVNDFQVNFLNRPASTSDDNCLPNELPDQMPQSSVAVFESWRFIFNELITRNRRLNEKVVQLEKQFHQCLNDQNDRLNTAQVQIKEVHTENVQMKKQFDEQIIRCNELQNHNQSLKEQLKQFEKRCQQENQPCTRQLEETNNRLNACIIQLNVRLNSNEIQMEKFEDEHKRLKEQVNLLEKQSLQQHRNPVQSLKDSNDRMNLCLRQFNDRSKKSEEVQIGIKQLKEQTIQYKPHVNNYEADSKSQKVTIVQNDEKHNMKHIPGN